MPTVQLYANLRKLVGTKEVPVAAGTVESVLQELVALHPALAEAIFEGNGLRPFVILVLNGHNVMELTTTVKEEDILAVFPPIAGG